MSDEEKKKEQQAAEAEATPAKSGSLIKYIIFGVVGLVGVVGIITATLMFVGVDHPVDQTETSATESEQTPTPKVDAAEPAVADESHAISDDSALLALENDPTVIEDIMQSLEFLDYNPEAEVAAIEEQADLTAEDSLEKVSWFKSETTRLTEWEATLKKKDQELVKLDKEVSGKLLKVEQAESTRISGLAKLYDGMDYRAVANLMANLDDETVVSILPRMKQKNASQVMALISAKRAARLSKQMITIAAN